MGESKKQLKGRIKYLESILNEIEHAIDVMEIKQIITKKLRDENEK